MIYIVLGMHKSGTTLVSKLLHQSGVNMVEGSMTGYDYDHIHGKMERQSALFINHSILQSFNVDSLDLNPALENSLLIDEEINEEIKKVIQINEELYKNWGIKDPRMCLTYKVWKKHLPEHKLILVYRHPDEVIGHYAKYYRWPKKLIKMIRAGMIYFKYNKLILETLKETQCPVLLVNYEHLMLKEKSIARLESFIECKISDLRDAAKYRNKSNNSWKFQLVDLLMMKKISKIYEELNAANEKFNTLLSEERRT